MHDTNNTGAEMARKDHDIAKISFEPVAIIHVGYLGIENVSTPAER